MLFMIDLAVYLLAPLRLTSYTASIEHELNSSAAAASPSSLPHSASNHRRLSSASVFFAVNTFSQCVWRSSAIISGAVWI